jgi:hypothetical protein
MQKIDQGIFLKGKHQAAVVYLSQLALSAAAAASYAMEAAVIITQVLEVEYSLFWELADDPQNLVLMAASGDIKNFSPPSSFPLHPNSLEEATLASVDPLTFENSRNETALHFLDPISARKSPMAFCRFFQPRGSSSPSRIFTSYRALQTLPGWFFTRGNAGWRNPPPECRRKKRNQPSNPGSGNGTGMSSRTVWWRVRRGKDSVLPRNYTMRLFRICMA